MEQMRILKMLEEGKINADEAQKLLAELDAGAGHGVAGGGSQVEGPASPSAETDLQVLQAAGVNVKGAQLEGVLLAGADLTDANFSICRCEPGQTAVPPPRSATSLRKVMVATRKGRGKVLWPCSFIAWSMWGVGCFHSPSAGKILMARALPGFPTASGGSPQSWAAACRKFSV